MKNLLLSMWVGALFACCLVLASGPGVSYAMGSSQPERTDLYYVCGCGPDCNCNSVSKEPGKCKCGKDMVQMHLLDIQDGKALFCTCGAECTCKLDPNDPTKCGCGKPVKVVDLKGKYVCACGKDCKCGSISDTPGKCRCGQEMKMVE